MDKILRLQEMINESNYIVFFGGAGVSTESGIKDFRSQDGLYNQKFLYPAEFMLSNFMFNNHPKEFFDFYRENLNCLDALPNITHKYLKKLEDKGKLKAIITQNIDGLHTKAKCHNVYEIHGTIYKNHCTKCHKEYDALKVFNEKSIPKCTCGGIIKPDVILYGESLDESFSKAIEETRKSDMLIIAGTSLTVEPACSLIKEFKGKYLVILNKTATIYDKEANLVINDYLKNIFEKLK